MHQCIKFILFWNDTLHVSDGLSVHDQEFKTVHTATGIYQSDTAVCFLVGQMSKIPANEPPLGSPTGAHMKTAAHLQGLFIYLPNFSQKFH